VLRRLKLLDSEPEERFDRFARLAGVSLGMPICRHHAGGCEARVVQEHLRAARIREVPREHSFCECALAAPKRSWSGMPRATSVSPRIRS